MESFLRSSKMQLANLKTLKKVKVVLGNQTCDLDSAVCALVQAFCQFCDEDEANIQDIAVIPVMNILQKEFRIKTEVVYHLKKNNVPLELLTFRDQINLHSLNDENKLELTLVDHHTLSTEDLPLADAVVEIFDHRPEDPTWSWPGRKMDLQIVGSCATLIARNILKKHPVMVDSQVSELLRGPILIDTSNFSKQADRATPEDVDVMDKLEKIVPSCTDRNELYGQILAAKTDTSSLTPSDLLIRDLKIANGIPMPGLPMLVESFIKMDGAYGAINVFTRERNSSLTILMGLDLKNDVVTRDIAVFSLSGDEFGSKVIHALMNSDNPNLDLTIVTESSVENGHFILYRQGNLKASRKQVLPIVKSVSAACKC